MQNIASKLIQGVKKTNASKKTILVIDDDSSIRTLLEILLKKNYQVITVQNGYDALVWLERNDIPDLIVADIQMPRINGFQFIKNIKKSGFYRDIPIIVLSCLSDVETKQKIFQQGVDEFLLKPFNPNELINKVFSVIRKQQKVKYA